MLVISQQEEKVTKSLERVSMYIQCKQLIRNYQGWKAGPWDPGSLPGIIDSFILLRDMDPGVIELLPKDSDCKLSRPEMIQFQQRLTDHILESLHSVSAPFPSWDTIDSSSPVILKSETQYTQLILALVKLQAGKVALSHLLRLIRSYLEPHLKLSTEPPTRSDYFSCISSVFSVLKRFLENDCNQLQSTGLDQQVILSYLVQPLFEDIRGDFIALWKAYFAQIHITHDRQEDKQVISSMLVLDQDTVLTELSVIGSDMNLISELSNQSDILGSYQEKWNQSYLDLESDYLVKGIAKSIQVEEIIFTSGFSVISSVEDAFFIWNKVLSRSVKALPNQVFLSNVVDKFLVPFYAQYLRKYLQNDLPVRLKRQAMSRSASPLQDQPETAVFQQSQIQLFVNSCSLAYISLTHTLPLFSFSNARPVQQKMLSDLHNLVEKKSQECFQWFFLPLLQPLQASVFYSKPYYAEPNESASRAFIQSFQSFMSTYFISLQTGWHPHTQAILERLSVEHILIMWESSIYQHSYTLQGSYVLMDEIRAMRQFFSQSAHLDALPLFQKLITIAHLLSSESASDAVHVSPNLRSILSLRLDIE